MRLRNKIKKQGTTVETVMDQPANSTIERWWISQEPHQHLHPWSDDFKASRWGRSHTWLQNLGFQNSLCKAIQNRVRRRPSMVWNNRLEYDNMLITIGPDKEETQAIKDLPSNCNCFKLLKYNNREPLQTQRWISLAYKNTIYTWYEGVSLSRPRRGSKYPIIWDCDSRSLHYKYDTLFFLLALFSLLFPMGFLRF